MRGEPLSKMKNKTKKITSLLICCILSAAGAQPVSAYEDSPLQSWIVREYNQSNGLPTGEANTVLQTSDGYIWIGSYGGLIRYDGTSFRNYSEEGSIDSSSIRILFEDSKGRLWIGTNDMGVYLCENNEFTLLTHEDRSAYLSVRSFAEDGTGTVYAGTTSGLARVTENGMEAVEAVSGSTVYSIQADKNSVLWACLDGGIAKLVKNDEVIYTFDSAKFLDTALYCAGRDREGDLWLGTDGSLIYELDFNDDAYTDGSFKLTPHSTGTVSTFNAIGEDLNGNIWAAALNGTGYLDGDGDWHSMDTEHAAAANDLAFDYEGNIWIASASYGVIHLVSGLLRSPNAAAGLSETTLNAVAVSGGNYYIGTDTGLIMLDGSFTRVKNELTELLEGDRIRNILADSSGNIWIGTYYSNGLVLYEPDSGTITPFAMADGLTSTQIRHIIELSDGGIAVATQHGVNIIRDGKVTDIYTEAEGLTYPIILTLCEGTDGTLYAGSDGQGIFAIKNGQVTHYGFDEGLSAGVVLRMANNGGDGLFISAGNNLYYWDFETFAQVENYRKSAGSIFDIRIVGDELWLMQSNGVNILDLKQLMSGEETPVNLIGAAYGLTGSLNANTWNVISDGTVYLCTSNGLSLLEIDALNTENADINAVISQVTADDITFENPDNVSIAGNTTRLTFRFAPLAFSGTDVTVRYRLVGFDDRAYTLINDSAMSASYTNLSGGDYEFTVEILGRDGETVIDRRSVTVHKDYTVWERPWFRAIIAVAALLLVFLAAALIIRAKTMTLRRRQQEYRDIISQALRTFANTIDAKDKYTNGHSARVAHYSVEIARRLKLSEEDQERIYYIALLHDIGKIGIPDSILTKPDKLTPEERQMIMRHPAIGGEILKDFTSLEGISDGARYHHERYDGTGYNEGLKGEEIPYFARIICVADSYDAMSSVRYYQGHLSNDIIIKELKEGSGSQFDPQIAEVMLQLIKEGKAPCSELLKPLDDISGEFTK